MLEAVNVAWRGPAHHEFCSGSTIRPLSAFSRFSLRLPEWDVATVGQVGGFLLNQKINCFDRNGERLSLRLGPNEWLLIGPEAESQAIAADASADLSDRFHALVDVSHRNVAIEIAGRHAVDVVNAGCPLDLLRASFPTGSATRTVLSKAEIVLARVDDKPTFRIECWRSFATYVHGFLVEAARDFG